MLKERVMKHILLKAVLLVVAFIACHYVWEYVEPWVGIIGYGFWVKYTADFIVKLYNTRKK